MDIEDLLRKGDADGVKQWIAGLGENGALNTTRIRGHVPLSLAVSYGHVPIVDMLLQAGADPSERNAIEQTAIWSASKVALVKLLLEAGAEIDLRDTWGRTPVHGAATSPKSLPVLKHLLKEAPDLIDVQSRDGDSALHSAATQGLAKSVQVLINAGANLDLVGSHNLTALMSVCSNGGAKGAAVAILLLDAKANVHHVRASDRMTALHFAAKSSHPDVVRRLLDAGAAVDGSPEDPQTPLMLAARSGRVDALELLVAHGADVRRTCGLPWANGWTAEDLAKNEKRTAAASYLAAATRKEKRD